MADIHWIKLKVDMFDNEKIKLIEAMPDADSILVIWIKLLTYAGKANSSGYIMLTESIPMNEEELATIFNRPLNTIRYALQIFERYGMIEREDERIRIKNWDAHQNIEGMERIREQNRLRKQKQREAEKQKKLSQGKGSEGGHVKSRDSHATEKRKRREREDKETDKEREKEREKHSLSHNQETFDILSDRGVSMRNSQPCYKISQMMSDIDDIQYLHEAIDEAEKRSALNANYILKIIENWFEEGKDSYENLMKTKKRGGQKPLTKEQKEMRDKFGF